MKWVKFNQKKIKSELYSGLVDAVAANNARAAGTFTVLPSSVLGSPRYMQAKYQDAMAMVRKLKNLTTLLHLRVIQTGKKSYMNYARMKNLG